MCFNSDNSEEYVSEEEPQTTTMKPEMITPLLLRVQPLSHQNGKARYEHKEPEDLPSVASYRNNLTAFSQNQNLLFIAYDDEIHVFKPIYPYQTLLPKPELIVKAPFTEPNLYGFIHPEKPNNINHLIVGDFGNEEILLAACDCGGVFSYTIRSIELMLDDELGGTSFVKPWFKQYVGASAWGLAIHKTARLIAVSSNTHDINVFVPALSKVPDFQCEASEDDASLHRKIKRRYDLISKKKAMKEQGRGPWQRPLWATKRCHHPTKRSYSVVIVLKGHRGNIPNISFFNSDLQSDKIYLASTDIQGWTYVWDVWRGKPVLTTPAAEWTFESSRGWGWGVACLDSRLSLPTDGPVDTFGCRPIDGLEDSLIDISVGARMLADNWHIHPAWFNGTGEGLEGHSAAIQEIDSDESDKSETESSVGSHEESLAISNDTWIETPWGEYAQHGPQAHAILNGAPVLDVVQNPSVYSSPMGSPVPEDKGLLQGHFGKLEAILPFTLLQTTQDDIHLFRGLLKPNQRTKADVRAHINMVVSKGPLYQIIPPELGYLSCMERLNMIHQIPDINVVLVGSQVGRVGILTMTYWKSRNESGFKFEAIVPFRSQERLGQRPEVPLMGIAVSPMQNHRFPKPDDSPGDSPPSYTNVGVPMRYRLLLIYCDHTVLAYEIFRPSVNEEILVI